jgi:fructokinase
MRWFVTERRLDLAVLTLGCAGSLFVTRERQYRQGAFVSKSSAGDSVGAGDAFAAVLAHGLARTLDLELIAEQASRYSGYVASQPGAMPEIPKRKKSQFLANALS